MAGKYIFASQMKKIDKLVTSSFIGPYMLSFFVAEFVLIMQLLWKYIDEILGKGFTMYDILELLFYYGVTIIPLAVPITILISSVMVFGDISEKYELTSMKSAGVSLLRVMRPAIYIAVGTALFSIVSSNFFKPRANYLFMKRFAALRKQKPALTIEEGIFNKDFKGYAIRVENKDKDGKGINDVLIYDHTDNDKSKMSLIKSKSGEMYTMEDGRFFVMNLREGNQYRELNPGLGKDSKTKYPFIRTNFKTWQKVFDMSEFELDDDAVNINRNKEDMLTTPQLLDMIDSTNVNKQELQLKMLSNFDGLVDIFAVDERDAAKLKAEEEAKAKIAKKDTSNAIRKKGAANNIAKNTKPKQVKYKSTARKTQKLPSKGAKNKAKLLHADSLASAKSLFDVINPEYRKEVSKALASISTTRKDFVNGINNQVKQFEKQKGRYQLKLHQSYSWAVICIIFCFIGAPLGSIIRKGGYGYPLLVAILFYMVFMIMTIMGDKLTRNATLGPEMAAWLPCIILAPVAAYLTYKALKDSQFTMLSNIFNKIKALFPKKASEEQIS